MAARELLSFAIVMTSLLGLLMELSAPAMAFQANDLLGPSEDSVYGQADAAENDLSEMLQLLGALLETSYGSRPTKGLADKTPFSATVTSEIPHRKTHLRSLLSRILSSSTSFKQEPNIFPSSSLDDGSYEDDIPVLTIKRARDEDYGAMPPLNELCRMMRVKCY